MSENARIKILESIGATSKKAVLVEGEDDKIAYEFFLDKKYTNWEKLLLLYSMGGKGKVIKELKKSPDFMGIIDKDEWLEADITKCKIELSNLAVIPRYFMDSYLIVPREIWKALPSGKKEQVKYDAFEKAILETIDDWTRHAALWHAVLPLYHTLRNAGFNQIILEDIIRIRDESFIKEKLNEWYNSLDPAKTFEKYLALYTEIKELSVLERLHKWIHGKKFWEQHVSQKIVSFFGQEERDKYAAHILRCRDIPADWDEIWPILNRFQPKLEEK